MNNHTDLSAVAAPGLASILIPCAGMLEYTKLCVPSILKHTRPPFELVFLDIGSLDGTAEYLAGLQAGAEGHFRIEVLRCENDRGLKEICQQALRLTLGEYVVLLNNDCVVTNAWLNQLVGLASFTMPIGMAGPMSNMAAPPQLVEVVPYRTFAGVGKSAANPGGALVDVAAVERFADKLRTDNGKKWLYADRLGGFCMLVKRAVLDKLGPALDEWSDLSLFDSDILSAKATQAGFSLAVCRDLYVHHFGTRTFAHGPKIAAEPVSTNGAR